MKNQLKWVICVLVFIVAISINSHAQGFDRKFSFTSVHIDLGTRQAHINSNPPDFSGVPAYLKALDEKGKDGYDLVQVVPTAYLSPPNVNIGVTLIFKKEVSAREKHLEYLINKIDSVSDNYVQKKVAEAKVDLISLLNEHTKTTFTKEFTVEIEKLFNSLLKQHFDKMKNEILAEINSN